MASLVEIMAALADQIRTDLGSVVSNLQVEPRLTVNPSPPAIDIYPADPFQERVGFGAGNNQIFLTVRARVNTPDHVGAQELLLSLMDPASTASVVQAVEDDTTLGGEVGMAVVTSGPSNYGIFVDAAAQGAFLGCTWTVTVLP